MDKQKVSVIIPSYNQGNYIERTLLSLLNQNKGDFELEVIVIDGGSTDHTLEILKRYSSKINWVSETDKGQTNAINKGLKMMKGDIWAYLNSDDTYHKNTIKTVVNFFNKNPKCNWIYGKCRIIDEKDNTIRKFITWYRNLMSKKFSYKKLLIENYIPQPATFFRKEIYVKCGKFDEKLNYNMDYEYWLRIGRKYKPTFINSYLADFRIHSTSKSGSSFEKMYKENLQIARLYTDNVLLRFLHSINNCKIVWIYKLMNFFKK